MATTAITTRAKTDWLSGAFSCLTPVTTTATSGNATFTLTSLASTAGIAVGMAITGTNITAGAVVASVDSATQITMSKASGASPGANSTTFTSDKFNILLIKVAPTGTYDGTLVNVGTPGAGAPSTTNVGTDEVTGTGYTSGGLALTNVSPVNTNPTTSAAISFSGTIQWTGATISTVAAVIYNTTARLGAAAAPLNNHTASVHDFGGTQTVTAGTLTLTMPTQDGTTGIIRAT